MDYLIYVGSPSFLTPKLHWISFFSFLVYRQAQYLLYFSAHRSEDKPVWAFCTSGAED